MPLEAGHPPIYLQKDGLRLVPRTYLTSPTRRLDQTYGNKALVKRNDAAVAGKLSARLESRRYDYTFGADSPSSETRAYWGVQGGVGGIGRSKGATSIKLSGGLPAWDSWSMRYIGGGKALGYEQPGQVAFSPLGGYFLNTVSNPFFFRINPSVSINGEHWWLCDYGVYFSKIDYGGNAANSDSPVGRYSIVQGYKNAAWNGSAWNTTWMLSYGGAALSPCYAPGGSTPGYWWDTGMDISSGVGRRYADGTVDKSWGNSYLEWYSGYPAWVDITKHVWPAAAKAHYGEIAPYNSNALKMDPADPGFVAAPTGVSTTTGVRWLTHHGSLGNFSEFPFTDFNEDIEIGQYIYLWKDGEAEGTPIASPAVSMAGNYFYAPHVYWSPPGLAAGTKYHMRVDTYNWDSDGVKHITTGDVWTFTTA